MLPRAWVAVARLILPRPGTEAWWWLLGRGLLLMLAQESRHLRLFACQFPYVFKEAEEGVQYVAGAAYLGC